MRPHLDWRKESRVRRCGLEVDQNGPMLRERTTEVLLVVLIVLVAAIGLRTSYQPLDPEGNIDRFESLFGLEVGDPQAWFTTWSYGDGQVYAIIAADVSGQELADHVREPAYRFARAGFGWTVAALSLGQPELIPYALALAGGLSLLGVLALAIQLRGRIGPRAWWVVLNPALFIGFAGDTSESLGILLLVAAMGWGSSMPAVLLGVTRPTFLISVWGRWRLFLSGAAGTVALAGYSLLAFGRDGFTPIAGSLAFPFTSYLEHLSLAGVVLAVAALGTIVVGTRARDLAWILAGGFVLSFGLEVLRDPVNAWRAAGFLPVMWAFGPAGGRSDARPDVGVNPSNQPADVG